MSGPRISGFDWENGLILSPVPGMSPLLADFLGLRVSRVQTGKKGSEMRPVGGEEGLKLALRGEMAFSGAYLLAVCAGTATAVFAAWLMLAR